LNMGVSTFIRSAPTRLASTAAASLIAALLDALQCASAARFFPPCIRGAMLVGARRLNVHTPMICFGGLVVGQALAWELTQTFLSARFEGAERYVRRLAKVADLEVRL
jgi:hypothetical protein